MTNQKISVEGQTQSFMTARADRDMLDTTKAENCAFDGVTNVECYPQTGISVNVRRREAQRFENTI